MPVTENFVASIGIIFRWNFQCFNFQLESFASVFVCIQDTKPSPPPSWLTVSQKLKLPFDRVKRYYLEYDEFDPEDHTVKQADAVLLNYPLQIPMSLDIKCNNLQVASPHFSSLLCFVKMLLYW